MEDVKQILVVDDYFQMLEFLRSVLEFSHHEYQVLAVPSAEEGILELRRTRFDLVITDVRLPGMSGFDLVRKVKGFYPMLPIIMITGYSSEQGKREADELGVKRYFKKPLNPDELLATVHKVLYGTAEAQAGSESEPEAVDLSADVRRRLETLRSDTGARHVVLSNDEGQILYDDGVGQALDLPDLVVSITESMQASFQVAQKLGGSEPFTIQYQAGEKYDVYLANVGLDYYLSIFFDAKVRRGRLGTIWVFAQRAINDLQGLLEGEEETAVRVGAVSSESVAEKEKPSAKVTKEQKAPETAEEVKAETAEVEAVPELDDTQEVEPLSLADLQEMLGIDGSVEDEDVDLDSFWDSALEASDDEQASSGMSLDEARKRGLIPTEFDEQERPKKSDQ